MTPMMIPSMVRKERILLPRIDLKAIWTDCISHPVSLVHLDLPVHDMQGSLRVPGNIRVVRDQHDGVALFVQMIEHLHDFRACLAVQVACGLVSQDQLGFGGQRPGNGDSLLLPARQLLGPVFHTVFQPDQFKRLLRLRPPLATSICW